LDFVLRYIQCSYNKKKKRSRATAALLNCSRALQFLRLAVAVAAYAVAVVLVVAATAVLFLVVAAAVVVILVVASAAVVVVAAAAVPLPLLLLLLLLLLPSSSLVLPSSLLLRILVAVVGYRRMLLAAVKPVCPSSNPLKLVVGVSRRRHIVRVLYSAGKGDRDVSRGRMGEWIMNALDGPPISWVPPCVSHSLIPPSSDDAPPTSLWRREGQRL